MYKPPDSLLLEVSHAPRFDHSFSCGWNVLRAIHDRGRRSRGRWVHWGLGGKKVSDALSTIFGKVDQQTSKAAKTTAAPPKTPLLETGPAVVKMEPGAVPPPPPLPGERVTRRAAVPVVKAVVPEPVVVPGPPPPQMTAADLRSVTPGMNRDAVLQMGQPAERITMVETDTWSKRIVTYRTTRSWAECI